MDLAILPEFPQIQLQTRSCDPNMVDRFGFIGYSGRRLCHIYLDYRSDSDVNWACAAGAVGPYV